MRQCDRGQHAGVHRQDSFAMQDENEEDEESQHPSGKSESEEEDYESFFLQPASCPYNIKEKIAEANAQLLEESLNGTKQIRVKFRSDLVDFEPDLTDDDVQSIESYTEEVINVNEELKYVLDNKLCNIIEEEIIEESIFETIIEFNHQQQCAQENEEDEVGYSSPEETEDIEEVEGIEEVEEIIEDIDELPDLNEVGNVDDIDCIIEECPEVPAEIPTPSEIEKLKSLSRSQETESESFNLQQTLRKNKSKNIKKRRLPHEINCKKHCVEELESRLDLCINNLRLNENITKPICPTLRLHRQKCCSGGCKIEQKLPLYTGERSEYGLTSNQIERLAKRKESSKLKEEKERELSEAYRRRKIQQNEIIFRQWLKDVAVRRNIERAREKEIISRADSGIARTSRSGKNYFSSGESTQRTTARIGSKEKHEKRGKLKKEKQQKASKARPKTANCITSLQLSIVEEGKTSPARRRRRPRPHTTSSSTARIYIEIPEYLLDDGFNLGELFIKQLDFRNGKGNGNSRFGFNGTEKNRSRLHITTKANPDCTD